MKLADSRADGMVISSGDSGSLELAELVDVPALQGLLGNLHKLAGLPLAVIDVRGKVLASVGWQDICTRFHRVHPETCRNCIESDSQLPAQIPAGEHRLYKCKNNMWDVATPLIVDGARVGNLFTGQFIFADEEPDRAFFTAQAARYGFPEKDYLAALERVPRPSREHVNATMRFFTGLAQTLSQAGLNRVRLIRAAAARERAAEVLRASERRMAQAQKFAKIGNWDLDAVTRRLIWSDGMCEIFGLKPQEFDGTFQAFLACVHPDDRGAFEKRYSESLRERRDDFEVEYRAVRAATGEIRTIHAKGEYVRDGSGRVVGSRGLAHDVTEIKIRENELRQINRTLKARNLSDQALVRSTDMQEYLNEVCRIVVEVCGHAQVFVGLAEQDKAKTVRTAAYAGCTREDVETFKMTWADTARGRGPTGTAIRTGKPRICRNIQTDPNIIPWRELALKRGFQSSAALPLLADGKAFGTLTVYSRDPDIFTGEEVALLTGLADDLAYGIGAMRMRAARQQAEARFQQAQKMEAVGLLAGGIAHDFNNLLAAIVGYNSLLLDGLKGNPLRAHSLEIQRSSEMAATLTQQLLGVSGNRGGQRRILDPNSVIMAMAKMLRRLVGEKIRLDLQLHRGACQLQMDSGQLEQIVLNLAVNARDAMPKGGRLTLSTRNVLVKRARSAKAAGPPPGRYVAVEVRDSGIGMDAAVQSRIFEPFFTTKGPGRGTGLGLATVKTIVDEYAGHVAVSSKPAKGSLFRVLLPSARGGVKGMASGGRIRKSQRGHEAILVVEDNASLLTVIEMTLRQAGYAVFIARTAEEAVSRCGMIEKNIDLLLTDVVLPDMDGPELAKRLKKQRPGMRTVYMSGYPGNALGPIAGFGGCVLLEKPFTPREMLSALRRVLDIDQGDLF